MRLTPFVLAAAALSILSASSLAAQGFCSDLSGPEVDRCRQDYYENADAVLGIVYRRALEGLAAPAQSRLRQEQAAWAARRTRLAGVTRARPKPAPARLDTLIGVTESRINELGPKALERAPWLVGILPNGAAGGDSLADVIAMRNDVWRFASFEESWVHAGHEAYAGQDSITPFRPTTGHAVTVLFASADGWSAIVTSDGSSTLCGMFRGDVEAQDPNLVEEGRVTCW
jgi:uncharacterized protein YecT (DUF1311 family)